MILNERIRRDSRWLYLCSLILAVVAVNICVTCAAYSEDASNPLAGIDAINRSKSCFSGPFESHQSWVEFLEKKNDRFDRAQFLERSTQSEFDRHHDGLSCYFFSYSVDGLDIGGYLVAPRGATKLPVIVFNRGGTGTFGQMTFASLYTHVFDMAHAGFVVIGSQYRGGMGKPPEVGGADEWGGGDVNDVKALFDIVGDLPIADSERLGMYGVSRGAINMFLASQAAPNLKAMVSASGVYDLAHELQFRPAMRKVYEEHIPGFTVDLDEALSRRSVVKWLDRLNPNAPILILHGEYDKRVSADGALSFANGLQKRWHPYSLVIFEGDNHFLSNNKEKALRKTIAWFKKYL